MGNLDPFFRSRWKSATLRHPVRHTRETHGAKSQSRHSNSEISCDLRLNPFSRDQSLLDPLGAVRPFNRVIRPNQALSIVGRPGAHRDVARQFALGELIAVSQIRMDAWSRGRVALVGDAAACVSLLAGQGSALAMTCAYVLAGELKRANGRHEAAFANYERLLPPFIAAKQNSAARLASSFAPRTRRGLVFRNAIMKAFRIPRLARLTVGRDLTDRLTLPDYSISADHPAAF